MNYFCATMLVLLDTVWLALVVAGLPGNWLMVASAALLSWWLDAGDGGGMFSLWTLMAVLALAALGEVLEFFAGAAGSTRAGGSALAAAAALLGGIIGAIVGTFVVPIPILGSLIGACGGACGGSLLIELSRGRGMDRSLRIGLGAAGGRLLGTLGKLTVGSLIWLILAVAAFWP